jgi:hypothetical protein
MSARSRRRYGPRDRSSRYIRCQRSPRSSGYQVRIPLERSGRRRHTLGSWPTRQEAQFARDMFLRAAGVRASDPPRAVHAKVAQWLWRSTRIERK